MDRVREPRRRSDREIADLKITVLCFGGMREYLPDPSGNRAILDVAEGARAGDVVDALGAPRGLVFSLLVDGERADLDRALQEGSEVTLMPPFTGGAHVE